LLISDREEITLIDFPQMVSTSHPNAEMFVTFSPFPILTLYLSIAFSLPLPPSFSLSSLSSLFSSLLLSPVSFPSLSPSFFPSPLLSLPFLSLSPLCPFPESSSNREKSRYFDRDVTCVRVFFQRRYGYETTTYPTFKDCVKVHDLDVLVAASGFTKEHAAEFDEVCE
jgi:hypothetical protein